MTLPDLEPLLPDADALRRQRQRLVEELQPSDRRSAIRWRRARRLALAAAGVFAIGGGAAVAGGVFSANDVAVRAGIGCYDRATLDANVTVLGPTADPVTACARLWREGVVSGRPEAPALVACTAEEQPVRVLPGSDVATCTRLGLKPLPRDYDAAAERARTAP